MQYKYKKKLYKILFIVILLSFIVSLVGCDWFSLGLLNIFDPQAQIRIKNFGYKDDYKNIVNFEVFSINQVEFIISGFELEYYRGSTKLDSLKSTIGTYYYVAPSSSPGEEGTPTKISDLYLYSPAVKDYVKTYSAFNEISCDLFMLGDGAGHDLKIKVASGLAALGVDNTPPEAIITITPSEGDCPLTVIFDGSGSNDGDGIGLAKYEWYLPQISTSIISTDICFSKELSCDLIIPATDSGEVITVSLTVTDYHGNEDTAASSVSIKN